MRALAAFALAVLVFHHVPALSGRFGHWADLATPLVVAAAAAAVLVALRPRPPVLALALAAAVLYVDGHGIHLSANEIRSEQLAGPAETTAYFWDERFGHIEWHLGWLGLIVAFCLAERLGSRPAQRSPAASALVVLLLGFTLFTSTIEGQDWWLVPPVAAGLALWALLRRGPVLRACAGAVAFAAVLMAVWAVWHGGMPEFSDLGWI